MCNKSSLSAPPPPVTAVPNVVKAPSPQFAASPSLIEAIVPGTAGGSVAKVSAGSAVDGRVSVPVGSAACANKPANAVQMIAMQAQVVALLRPSG